MGVVGGLETPGRRAVFDERVRTETKQVPETEKQLRGTVAKLKETIADQRAGLEELRRPATNLTLASAVLTVRPDAPAEPAPAPDNVIPFRPPIS
ncbi:hypothetical protein [Streptomyces sp. NPDC020141]|uniref:hypothetical protein n=1 Tax=Streptomyces sp. NPDC020141 TaxID=3365065 RepID=UPI0037BAD2FF